MIDYHSHQMVTYEAPALVRIGAIMDIAEELEKFGAVLKPSVEYHPGDPVDWSNGRVS